MTESTAQKFVFGGISCMLAACVVS